MNPARIVPRKFRFRLKKPPVPYAPPGTIQGTEESHPTTARVHCYGPDTFHEEPLTDPEKIRDFLGKWRVTWIQVQGLADVPFIQRLGEILGLHSLALEDVLNTDQRPKWETYEEAAFFVTRIAVNGEENSSHQLSLFLGKGFVLTFEEKRDAGLEPLRERIRRKQGTVRMRKADYLAYAILDMAIDSFFPILENTGERLDELEEQMVASERRVSIHEIHAIKSDLLSIRKTILPLREEYNRLLYHPSELFSKEVHFYLRDLYDHASRLADVVESDREMAADLMNLHVSLVNNGMNEVMKVLTMMASLFIPLSFIAGLYGMNFATDRSPWNMPELDWYYGYPFALLLMGATAGGVLWYFRRKGWLG